MLLAVELPPGSRLDDTRAATEEVARRIRARPEIKSVFVNGGNLLGSGAEVRKATLTINLVGKTERSVTQDAFKQSIGRELAALPDMRYWFLKDDGQRQFSLVVSGRDGAAVSKVAAAITSEAKRIASPSGEPYLANVVSTAELDRPELIVKPRSDLAADLGVSTDQISEAVRIATIGDVERQPGSHRSRRSPDPDSRAARGVGPQRARDARGAEGPHGARYGRSAVVRRHVRDEPGPDRHRPLRPAAPRADRRRPRRRYAARQRARCGEEDRSRSQPASRRRRSRKRATPRSWPRCSQASPRRWAQA